MLKFISKYFVLVVSIGILFTGTLFVFFTTETSYNAIDRASLWVRNYFGYFYLYLGFGCVIGLFAVAFSKYGTIKLGKQTTKPEYSLWSWIAMLYSAGMGSGILLRAVQEPVFMQQNPPFKSSIPETILALEFTFYQWGFTAWAFYGLFAVIVGYALHVKKKKVKISATIDDHLKSKILRGGVDILTIITTVFGLIAAVGLGTTQINGGLNHITNSDFGLLTTILLCVLISIIACYSAWQGVNKGIKIFSKLNIIVTFIILILVFVTNDMRSILVSFATATFYYIIDFIPMSLAIGSYNPGLEFLTGWTFYYWAFWLAWAPFTGIFIARISKGRTIRQLLLGVLIIPSIGTFFWFSVFGTSAFSLIEQWGVYNNEFGNVFSSIFIFFQQYPFATFLNITSIFLLISFLITSVDSAVFVLSMFTDNGSKNPKKAHRLIWSVFILLATIAIVLLGNIHAEIDVLQAVQRLLIVTSLPFSFFIIIMFAFFIKDIKKKL
ncbi:BCCT family transporter [Cellulophaga baltica]|uniref:BCCT family transporter n=1 Tax=Cellulophaga TaxID=104264 RepID=UPI001C0770C2|nr:MULTISPECIES: BCCT family transporter [Cellulophaga]MBU2996297.1 BCCT family transporter [Cellulophaga baltica]MDO6767692.1 BCCT family transporter [Cellulophaga sp. 1_MG-2023]